MRRRFGVLVLAVSLTAGLPARADAPDLAQHVDPFIGTMGSGFVFPGPAAPYGMVQLSPDTEGFFAYTGYMWIDQFIRGFSHVHVQSMGVPEGGNIPFMPTVGPVLSTDVLDYQSRYEHATEEAAAGYYKVVLDNYGVTAELTAGARVGMHRYTFPPVEQANVLLDVGRQIPGGSTTWQQIPGTNLARVEQVDARTVTGSANIDRAAPHGYTVHFAARFDRDIERFGGWEERGEPVAEGITSVEGEGAGAVVSFDAREDRDVVISVGISFVSTDNALENLDAEAPDGEGAFDEMRARTYDAWNEALRAIVVDGGTPADQRVFYTALYHAQHHPNVFNDVNGQYIGHDNQIHTIGEPGDPIPAGSTYYANFSMWDTYRAEMPLLALIVPDRYRDMMRSLAAIARWGGRFSRWSLMNRHADYMNGEPALQVIADGYCRGLVPDDVLDAIYDEGVRLALVDRRDPEYLSRGWTSEASKTLEHALGDFAMALFADANGEAADRDALLARSEQWRNVFDMEDTGFVRPRNDDGTWMDPYFPEMPDGFREGTGWQYTWLVPHDVRGLYDAMGSHDRGGDDLVLQRLDTFFSTALSGTLPLVMPEIQQKLTAYGIFYYGNQYAPSNEHDLQAPWLYNWTSQPWKTQAIQRGYQSLYRPTPDGLPGNDDLGTMSAWFVWSALGFYPVTPGAPVYTIGSPVFERAEISLPDGTFTVEAPGASLASKYVQQATLDGSALSRTWFTHDDITAGDSITIEMAAVPSLTWGSSEADRPPSASTHALSAFACTP